MPTLRPYQVEDLAASIEILKKHRRVIGRAATGTGKSILLASVAEHFSKFGRVLVMVDVKKLVRQLADSITWVTGMRPGIEMADEQAINDDVFCTPDQIIVSSVQTQYSGKEGRERYRKFCPRDFSAILLDEAELFLAPKARSVVDYYLNGNPDLVCWACTATPLRTDGVAMANLFDAVAFDRDIAWGIREGWLVKPRQAFVRVSADFSTLEVKSNDGEADYSKEEIASRIINEQVQIELAKGIVHVAEKRKSIIACPTVEVARAVAHYIDAEKPGSARCIYGELGTEEKDDIFAAFARNEFQFLSSVMLVSKGFDDPGVSAVFNCRKTKSKRLYTQLMGRSTRPLKGVVDGLDTAAERLAAIAASDKPDAIMVNLVGVEAEVRDVTILDILGEVQDDAVLERAKQKIRDENKDADEAMAEAEEEIELERAAEGAVAELEEERLEAEDEQRLIRSRVRVSAHVDVEYQDDLNGGYVDYGSNANPSISDRQMQIFKKAKLTDREIAALSPSEAKRLSQQIVYRWRNNLCSYKQAQALIRAGYSKEEVRKMGRDDASRAMDELKANHWKRPMSGV